MKFIKLLGLALTALLVAAAPLRTVNHKYSWFPKNDKFVPMTVRGQGITEAQFNAALDEFEKLWGPIVKEKGYNLKYNRLWKDGTVNSDTTVIGKDWVINAYGGLARYKGMTYDGYMLVACHELGHHLGGAPLYTDEDWASTEGQSDYFATAKCHKIMADKERTKQGSLVLAKVLADLGGDPTPKIDTPDPSVVTVTYEGHPAAQCRLDTYMAGIKCDVPGDYSMTDPTINACNLGEGARPRCWYAPPK